VWATFDTRQKAKTGDGANDVADASEPGLFGDDAGAVAAE
jgi:ribonucleoside-diphosphate reductase beta chain